MTDAVVEVANIAAAHADAAVGSRCTEATFFGGAVDVDGAAVGVAVALLGAGEPEDA